MIDPRHLKLLVEIQKHGSLSKASKTLNLTPSALSHQLKKLEDDIGFPLIHRSNHALRFTSAGLDILEKAHSILSEYGNLDGKIIELKNTQPSQYIHGYNQQEAQRLKDQANTVSEYIHFDSYWSEGSRILELGCGVGAQTEIIALQNPNAKITAVDISKKSLEIAQERINELGIENVSFMHGDVNTFHEVVNEKYDHLFICFLLEHLHNPLEILSNSKKLIHDDGTITLVEGDHGSTMYYPENNVIEKVIQAQVQLQKSRGGNANIGRQLYQLLDNSGYCNISVSPRQIFVDPSKPALQDGFIKNTFTAMMQGMEEEVLAENLMTPREFQEGIKALLETATDRGSFSYTFFKAWAK